MAHTTSTYLSLNTKGKGLPHTPNLPLGNRAIVLKLKKKGENWQKASLERSHLGVRECTTSIQTIGLIATAQTPYTKMPHHFINQHCSANSFKKAVFALSFKCVHSAHSANREALTWAPFGLLIAFDSNLWTHCFVIIMQVENIWSERKQWLFSWFLLINTLLHVQGTESTGNCCMNQISKTLFFIT